MAKTVIMFMKDEMYSGGREANEQFRKVVKEFASYILDGEITFKEYTTSSQYRIEAAFDETPDCTVVFTFENNSEAQAQACIRGIMPFEYRSFSSRKIVPVYVEKDNSDGITSYSINSFGIRPSGM